MSPPPPRVRALVAYDQKTLFDLIAEPRLEVVRLFDPDRPPDLIVLPCPRADAAFEKLTPPMPAEVWARAGLVFDGSAEGPELTDWYQERAKRFLAARGVPETRCVFITQNRLTRWPSVAVLHDDYWIRRLLPRTEAEGQAAFELRYAAFQVRPRQRPKRFLSLNFTPRPSKILFLLSLLRDDLWDQGYVSFGGFADLERNRGRDRQGVREEIIDLPEFEGMGIELAPWLDALESKGQILFGKMRSMGEWTKKPTSATLLAQYGRSWFSVTAESEMASTIQRVTEKSFKALMSFHSQVIFGAAGALQLLRSFGFESFSPSIDERYDGEASTPRRFQMAYAEVLRLTRSEESELARMEAALHEVLVANARRALVELPAEYRRRRDPQLVDELLKLPLTFAPS